MCNGKIGLWAQNADMCNGKIGLWAQNAEFIAGLIDNTIGSVVVVQIMRVSLFDLF